MREVSSTTEALAKLLGSDRLIVDRSEVRLLERDMGTPPPIFEKMLGSTAPSFGVRPRSVAELAGAVETLASARVPFTPRGLGSAGLGGAVPVAGGAVIDLSALSGLRELDEDRGTATVHAGTPFYFIEQAIGARGMSLLARPTNGFGTIGGWVSVGGIGLGSLGAGPAREHVSAMQVVLPNGRVERVARTDRGFDDFFDTEGQIGIIAEVTLRVNKTPASSRPDGFVFSSLDGALGFCAEVLQGSRLPHTAVLLGHTHEYDSLGEIGEGELLVVDVPEGLVLPSCGAHGGEALPTRATSFLWHRRFFPMDNPLGPVFLAGEAILPVEHVAAFVERGRRLASRYGVPLHSHSHAVVHEGVPSFLALLLFPTDPKQSLHHLLLAPLAASLTELAIRLGGKPYGIGIWNATFASDHFGADRFRELVRRKGEIDPDGLLNPGKFFRVGTHARALSALMHRRRYSAALRLASLTTPRLLARYDSRHRVTSTAERCVSCGACVPVCPAVVATGDESVSGRAKLALMARLSAGSPGGVDPAELLGSQRCLKCGQCEEVCARSLPLVEAWEHLEKEVRRRVPAPSLWSETLNTFTAQVDEARARVLGVVLP